MRWMLVLCLAGVLGACSSGHREAAREGREREERRLAAGLRDGSREEGEEGEEEETDGPDKALEWRRLRWRDERGEIAPDALRNAIAQRDANVTFWAQHDNGGISRTVWTEWGPTNVAGRTRSLVIDPTNPQRMWAGSVGGGIWASADGGNSWSPVNDQFPRLSIGCLAMDPTNPDVIYAGTGEGYFNGDALGGAGIYKTTDRGQTWTQIPATAGWDNVCRIAINPDNPSILLVGKRYGGILRSTDAGTTWATVRWAQGGFDVEFDPNNGNNAAAAIIDYDTDWFHAALYSRDGGATWTACTGLNHVNGFGGRIEVRYAKSSPGIVYASCADGGGKIWRSLDGGQSYTLRTTSGSSGCGWYANPLWVSPTDANLVITGGYHIYRSTDGGATLTQVSNGYIITQQPHPDIHNVLGDPGYDGVNNRRVYAVSDGGVFRADNATTANTSNGWVSRVAGYRSTQFYGADGDGPTGKILGGTQDNGTLRILTNPPSTTAVLTFGGDGGFCAIDPTDTNYMYGEYVTLQIHRSTNGGASASYITTGLGDAGTNANFIAPFILDPNNAGTMLAGGASLWRSTNVKAGTPAWAAIRAPGSDVISAIAVAPGNSNVIWVGQNNGEVWKTTNGTAANPTWTAVDNNGGTNPLPNRYITRIVIDPADANTVYVALGGFSDGNLRKTTNGGATFADITGTGATGLPLAPINGVARHPTKPSWLYVGTEVGIFASTDGGATWSAGNDGPANVSVDELVFMHGSTTLLAATHGRGLWTARVRDCPGDFNSDGLLNVNDFVAFQNAYAAGDARANCDGSTEPPVLNVNDFVCFLNRFGQGCP